MPNDDDDVDRHDAVDDDHADLGTEPRWGPRLLGRRHLERAPWEWRWSRLGRRSFLELARVGGPIGAFGSCALLAGSCRTAGVVVNTCLPPLGLSKHIGAWKVGCVPVFLASCAVRRASHRNHAWLPQAIGSLLRRLVCTFK